MKRSKIFELLSASGPREQVLVKGWVRTRRDAKDFSFLEINDGSCLANIQAVVDSSAEGYGAIKDIGTGASVAILGSLIPSPGKGQAWEVKAHSVEMIGAADQETFPLQKKRHSFEFLRAIAHLRPRTNKFGADVPHPLRAGLVPSTGFSRNAASSICTRRSLPAQRLRGRGGDVPGDHPRPGQPRGPEGRPRRTSSASTPASP